MTIARFCLYPIAVWLFAGCIPVKASTWDIGPYAFTTNAVIATNPPPNTNILYYATNTVVTPYLQRQYSATLNGQWTNDGAAFLPPYKGMSNCFYRLMVPSNLVVQTILVYTNQLPPTNVISAVRTPLAPTVPGINPNK